MESLPVYDLLPANGSDAASSTSTEPSVDPTYLERELNRSTDDESEASIAAREESSLNDDRAELLHHRSLLSSYIWAAMANAAAVSDSDRAVARNGVDQAISRWAYTPWWSLPAPVNLPPSTSSFQCESPSAKEDSDVLPRCGSMTPLPVEVLMQVLSFVDVRMLVTTCEIHRVCRRFAQIAAGSWEEIPGPRWRTLPLNADARAAKVAAAASAQGAKPPPDPLALGNLNRRCFAELAVTRSGFGLVSVPSHPLLLTQGGYEAVPSRWQYTLGLPSQPEPAPWLPSNALVDNAVVMRVAVAISRAIPPAAPLKSHASTSAGVRRIQTIEEMLATFAASKDADGGRVGGMTPPTAPPLQFTPLCSLLGGRHATRDFWVHRYVDASLRRRAAMEAWLSSGVVPIVVTAPARLVSGEASTATATASVTVSDGTVFTPISATSTTATANCLHLEDALMAPINLRALKGTIRMAPAPTSGPVFWDALRYEEGILGPCVDDLCVPEVRGWLLHYGESIVDKGHVLLVPHALERPLIRPVTNKKDGRGRHVVEGADLKSGCEDTPRWTMQRANSDELDVSLGNHTMLKDALLYDSNDSGGEGPAGNPCPSGPLFGMGYSHPFFNRHIANVSVQTKFHLSESSVVNHPQSVRHLLETAISNLEVALRVALYGEQSAIVRPVDGRVTTAQISDRFLQASQPLPCLLHAHPRMVTGYVASEPVGDGQSDEEGTAGVEAGYDIVAITTHHRNPIVKPVLPQRLPLSAAIVATRNDVEDGTWWDSFMEGSLMFPVWISKQVVSNIVTEFRQQLTEMASEEISRLSPEAGESGQSPLGEIDFPCLHDALLGRLLRVTRPFILTNPVAVQTTLVESALSSGHRRRAALLLERCLLLDAILAREGSPAAHSDVGDTGDELPSHSSYTYQRISCVCGGAITRELELLPLHPLPFIKLYQTLLASITFTDVNLHSSDGFRQTAVFSRITSPFGPSTVELRSFLSQMDSSHPRVLFKVVYSRTSGVPLNPKATPAATKRPSSSDEDKSDSDAVISSVEAMHTHPHHTLGSFYPSCGHSALMRDYETNLNTDCDLVVGGFGRVEVDIAPKVYPAGIREVATTLHLPPGFPLELLHNVIMAASGCMGWLNLLAPMFVGSFRGFTEGFDQMFADEKVS